MKKHSLFLMALIVILITGNSLFAELVEKIAIIVNDEMITNGDVDRMMMPVYEKYKTMYTGKKLVEKLEEVRQKVIQQLIEDKVILSEAKKQNIEVDDNEIDAKVADAVKRVGSRSDFDRALLEQQVSMKDLKVRYKEQLMTKKLIDRKIGAKILITPVEIDNYYKNHVNEFVRPEQLRVRAIQINFRDHDAQQSSKLAEEISKRLKEGGDFAGLAKAYSDGQNASEGGTLGIIRKGDLMPELEKVIFSLKEGECSDMVKTNLGYHFFKVDEKMPSRTLTLNESRRFIEEALFRIRTEEKLKGWLEGLKKNAYIAFK